MKELKLRNDSLDILISMLEGVSLKGTVSRMRTRFISNVKAHLEGVKSEHMQLVKEYAELNDEGEPIVNDNNYKIKDEEFNEFNEAYIELYTESMSIEINESNKKMLENILIALDEVEDLSGENAIIHYYTYDIIEKSLG